MRPSPHPGEYVTLKVERIIIKCSFLNQLLLECKTESNVYFLLCVLLAQTTEGVESEGLWRFGAMRTEVGRR